MAISAKEKEIDMMQYIRTKNGKIIKIIKVVNNYIYVSETTIFYYEDDIVKIANTIEELIDAGDLVEIDYGIETCTEKVCQPYRVRKANVEALYTKQGNDYILVAKKENGEWRVL